jgi:lysophospholipase L1-like esterase
LAVLGVLAFGDSITNGGGELQWGVALQSWALWLARAYGMPYSGYACDGATAAGVVQAQIPAFLERGRSGAYDLGCLYIGANDVRALDWDASAFARDVEEALTFLEARCERVLLLTLPLDLGRPRAGAKVEEANAILRAKSSQLHGYVGHVGRFVVVGLEDFGARNRVMTDHVHPTAFGQVEIAERAIRALGDPPKIWPSQLIGWEETRWRRLRGDATYAYRAAKVSARAAYWTAVAARRSRTATRGGAGSG